MKPRPYAIASRSDNKLGCIAGQAFMGCDRAVPRFVRSLKSSGLNISEIPISEDYQAY